MSSVISQLTLFLHRLRPLKWLTNAESIRPVWSVSSLYAWRKLGSLAIHWAHSKDSDQTGWMSRLIWVFAGCTVILLVLSWGGSNQITTLNMQPNLSLITRKPVFGGLQPVNTQTGLLYFLEILGIASIGIILSKQRTTKVLVRLRGCAGWSAPLLFESGINRFSHDVAHLIMGLAI